MADPLSITGSIIGVVAVALQSCRALSGLISSCKNAPKSLKDVRDDLDTLQSLMQSLERVIAGPSRTTLSPEQRTCILGFEPALQSCQQACSDFHLRLSKATSSSNGDQMSLADRLRLYLSDKDIKAFKSRVEACKQTLNVSLGAVTLNVVTDTQEKVRAFETQVATAVSGFTGQIQGIEFALQALQSNELAIRREDVELVVQTLNEHDLLLKQCLKACVIGLDETTTKTGTYVKYAETFDRARQFVGNIGDVGKGGPETTVDRALAHGDSRQVFGNTDASFAKDFLC